MMWQTKMRNSAWCSTFHRGELINGTPCLDQSLTRRIVVRIWNRSLPTCQACQLVRLPLVRVSHRYFPRSEPKPFGDVARRGEFSLAHQVEANFWFGLRSGKISGSQKQSENFPDQIPTLIRSRRQLINTTEHLFLLCVRKTGTLASLCLVLPNGLSSYIKSASYVIAGV